MHWWTSQGMEVTTYHPEDILHMHDRLAMIPRKQENFTQIHGDNFHQLHMNQRKSLLTSRTHTLWRHKVGSNKFLTLTTQSTMSLFKPGEIRMSSMGSTTNLSRDSKTIDPCVTWTRQSIGQTNRHEGVLRRNTTSRNTIEIVLGSEFDLTIAQLKSNVWEIAYPQRRYHFASTRQTRHPFENEHSRIDLLSFNSPSCRSSSTN